MGIPGASAPGARADKTGGNEIATYMRDEELAERWSMATKTIRNWRTRGQGPAFIKLNNGAVRYALADVLAYEAASRVEAVA
jgi:hypothetical protein